MSITTVDFRAFTNSKCASVTLPKIDPASVTRVNETDYTSLFLLLGQICYSYVGLCRCQASVLNYFCCQVRYVACMQGYVDVRILGKILLLLSYFQLLMLVLVILRVGSNSLFSYASSGVLFHHFLLFDFYHLPFPLLRLQSNSNDFLTSQSFQFVAFFCFFTIRKDFIGARSRLTYNFVATFLITTNTYKTRKMSVRAAT